MSRAFIKPEMAEDGSLAFEAQGGQADHAVESGSSGTLMAFEAQGGGEARRASLAALHASAPYAGNALASRAAAALGETLPLLRAFVATPSVNPDQVDDPAADAATCNERRMAEAVHARFVALGADEVHIDASGTAPERPNVMALFRAAPDAPHPKWLAIDTHLDTVAVKGMAPHAPFGAAVTTGDGHAGGLGQEEVYLHGRGSCDTKATLANVLALLGERGAAAAGDGGGGGGGGARVGLRHHLLLFGTVGEETGRLGAKALKQWLAARRIVLDELLVAEPTRCDPIFGHKGHVRLRFDIEGVPAHSSLPHLGKNAVVAAAALTTALYEEGRRLAAAVPPPRPDGCDLGPPTLTPTVFAGGSGINIVPGSASVHVDRRVTAGESGQQVCDELEALGRRVLAAHDQCACAHVAAAQADHVSDAFVQSGKSPLISRLLRWGGGEARVATFGTNASVGYDARAVVVFGPGDIAQAHQNDEWIMLSQLVRHKRVLQEWLFGDWAEHESRL